MARPKNEEGRAEIQREAARLFLEKGYAATSYADIAEATGRKRATVQSLFPKKSELATNVINRLVYGCQAYADGHGLSDGSPLGGLHAIGQLYFSALLATPRMRTFTLDVISDRAVSSNSLLFNEDWVREFLDVSEEEAERCMDGFVLAMGGGYEIVYQRLTAGEPIDIAALVGLVIESFVACCGIGRLQDAGPEDAPAPLDAATLADARTWLREYVMQ